MVLSRRVLILTREALRLEGMSSLLFLSSCGGSICLYNIVAYRRTPAWSNRASPSPGPAFNANSRGQVNGFPPLGSQANGKAPSNAWGSNEDKQQLLANLAGSIVSLILPQILPQRLLIPDSL